MGHGQRSQTTCQLCGPKMTELFSMKVVFQPYLGDDEKAAVTAALDLGWLGMGSYVAEFDRTVVVTNSLAQLQRLATV